MIESRVRQGYVPAFLLGLLFSLPIALPVMFSWMCPLLAVPVCLVFFVSELKKGAWQLFLGIAGAAVIAFSLQRVELLLFELTLCPLGIVLARGAKKGESVFSSGGKGLFALFFSLLFFWLLFAAVTESNPYKDLLLSLDKGFEEALTMYTKGNAELPFDDQYELQEYISSIRANLPKLVPAMWLSSLTLTVWLNLIVANRLIGRLQGTVCPWQNFSQWRLPEQFVWLPIVAAFLALLTKGQAHSIGLALLAIALLCYGFQGLAVSLAFFEKWRLPALARGVLIVFLLVQGFGLLVFLALGLSDVWINWRNRNLPRIDA